MFTPRLLPFPCCFAFLFPTTFLSSLLILARFCCCCCRLSGKFRLVLSLPFFIIFIHRLTPNMHAALVIVVSISYSHITRALALLHRLCTVVVDSLMPWLRHTMQEKMYENEENNNNDSSSTLRKNNVRNKKHKNKSKRHDGSGYEESRDLS